MIVCKPRRFLFGFLGLLCICVGEPSARANMITFSNTTPITILDSGAATPYPSSIAVSGLSGPIVKVTATIIRFSHTNPNDVVCL